MLIKEEIENLLLKKETQYIYSDETLKRKYQAIN